MLRQWNTRISLLLFGMLVARTKSDRSGDTTSQIHRLIVCTLVTTSPPCETVPFSFCLERDERVENLCTIPDRVFTNYRTSSHDMLCFVMLCTVIFVSQYR